MGLKRGKKSIRSVVKSKPSYTNSQQQLEPGKPQLPGSDTPAISSTPGASSALCSNVAAPESHSGPANHAFSEPQDSARETLSAEGPSRLEHPSNTPKYVPPSPPTSPAEFKTMILQNLHRHGLVRFAISCHEIKPENIPVMIYKGKKYGIIPTILVLKHEAMEEEGPDVNGDLVQFTYQSGQKFDPTNAGQGHCFLPLGYLTEFSTKEKSGRLTNYVWAINVTTDPKSLWLIYDYVTQDEMGDEMIANLSTVYMNVHNILNARKYTHQKLPSSKRPPTTRGYLGFEKRWDVIRVFANVDHWQPDDPGRYEPELDMAEELGNGLRAIPTYTSRHPY